MEMHHISRGSWKPLLLIHERGNDLRQPPANVFQEAQTTVDGAFVILTLGARTGSSVQGRRPDVAPTAGTPSLGGR